MARATQDRAVIQTVRLGRALAGADALLAILAFAVAIVFVHDRVAVIAGALLVGAIWGLGTVAMLSAGGWNEPVLMRIPAEALPPRASLPTALLPRVALFAAGAAFLLSSLYWLPHASAGYTLGIILGAPIAQCGSVLRSKRTERELGGMLWITPNLAWTSKGRDHYLALPE